MISKIGIENLIWQSNFKIELKSWNWNMEIEKSTLSNGNWEMKIENGKLKFKTEICYSNLKSENEIWNGDSKMKFEIENRYWKSDLNIEIENWNKKWKLK